MHLVGVDMGGTHLRVAIADANGQIQIQRRITTDGHLGPEGVMDRLADCIAEASHSLDDSATIDCIGVGVPGLVDADSGTIRFLPNLPTQWRDVPMGIELGTRLDAEVRLMNDARMATLGEWNFGHGAGLSSGTMVFLSLGTGVGGGVVVDGRLRLGPVGAAGEIGHQTVVADGPRCGCGNHGCLEAVAAGPAIVRAALNRIRSGQAPELSTWVESGVESIHPGRIAEAAATVPAMHDVLTEAFRWIGIGLANAVSMLHPDLVVVGGGVAAIPWDWETVVRSEIERRVRMFDFDASRVVRSKLGDDAGLHGALALAMRPATGHLSA